MRIPHALLVVFCCLICIRADSQVKPAPDRDEGIGPFNQMIIRGATLINGTGSPPFGPVDIVIEQNRIVDIRIVGYPGTVPDSTDRPLLKKKRL